MDINNLKKLVEAERSRHSTAAHLLQLVLFLGLFIGLFLLGCKLFSGFWMRALCLIIAYFISSLAVFFFIKPLCDKLDAKRRKK